MKTLAATAAVLLAGLITTSALAGASAQPAAGPAVVPYVDMTLNQPPFDLAAASRGSGVKHYTLGFVVDGGGCRAAWDHGPPVAGGPFAADVSNLRRAGGDVVLSFGGADGTELAQGCASTAALATQYRSAIRAYRAGSVDFDIEGQALMDPASIDGRSRAIAALEHAYPGLKVSLTLPVDPTGLESPAENVIRSALRNGARIDLINMMAMDYGAGPLRMGSEAIAAAQATERQLAGLYRRRGAAQLWRMIGVTPMIGANDDAGEVFTLRDAAQLTAFARAKHLGRLAFWASNRDHRCPAGTLAGAQDTCSSVSQSDWAFARAFAG